MTNFEKIHDHSAVFLVQIDIWSPQNGHQHHQKCAKMLLRLRFSPEPRWGVYRSSQGHQIHLKLGPVRRWTVQSSDHLLTWFKKIRK